MDRELPLLQLHVFRSPVCVCRTFHRTVPAILVLDASKTSSRTARTTDCGRWHRSKVLRVLQAITGEYAVVSTRGLICHCCAGTAAPCGYITSVPMSIIV